MNVALTRAKALLIVIGNPNLLKYDDKWRKYIQRCVDNSAIAGAPFSMDMEDDAELLEGFENIRIDGRSLLLLFVMFVGGLYLKNRKFKIDYLNLQMTFISEGAIINHKFHCNDYT